MTGYANSLKKATKLEEVLPAVNKNAPVPPGHPFFVDFSQVRGAFQDKLIYTELGINPHTLKYNHLINQTENKLIFLAGMRGSGKTSELARIVDMVHKPDAFFCVTCNLDQGLDLNDIEYMDVLIFQMERLVEEINEIGLTIDEAMVASFNVWYAERVSEVNEKSKEEIGLTTKIKGETPPIISLFLKLSAELKGSLSSTSENATKVRTVLKNNFTEYADRINEFIATVNKALREANKGKEILFVVDGLEKVATAEMRQRMIENESSRIRQIRANTIFTLPIELFSLKPKLQHFSEVLPFPFIKIQERNGEVVEAAIETFEAFVTKRIDINLFDSPNTIRKAILHSGGSPRELLRILEKTYVHADFERELLTEEALDEALNRLSSEYSAYLTDEDLKSLKKLKENNEQGKETAFNDTWQRLMENVHVMEYNYGTYKRVHPLIEISPIYQQHVG